ncbi:hypothetical protein TL16_g01305, partial [Triparma laevis f. inornata]|uniref:Uncharacterized protein n=2 Tax=Triparma laevis TaxID=1534972 RepID=A0A9W7FEQ4_9STRA
MSGLLAARVSQEAFDEVVKENMEDFEMAPDEAIADAIKQFKSQGVTLDNLDLSVPTDSARAARSKFLNATSSLDSCVQQDGTVSLSKCTVTSDQILAALKTVAEFCAPEFENCKIYRSLLVTNAAIYTLMNFLGVTGEGSAPILLANVRTLRVLTKESMELRDAFIAHERVNKLLEQHVEDAELAGALLSLIKVSCKNVENNKGYFMKSGGAKKVMAAMVAHPENAIVLGEACFCINTLCKFDDFRKEMSSAHENAKEFNLLGIVPALLKVTDFSIATEHTKLAVAAMNATRVLAVNDEIVQSLVACGLLDRTQSSLAKYIHDAPLVAAALGVYRNVCGNDEIKSNLCTNGSLEVMLEAMRKHTASPMVAEHGCGTLAAMALRKPENVTHIFSCDGAAALLLAMRHHPKNVTVQRQGCLAVRNIIARNPEFKEALLELGVEKILKDAGQYQGAVDEAYAGLRDLGFEAAITKFNAETGAIEKTQMFGESKANFGKSMLASNDIDERVDENAKPANECVRF